MTQDSNIVQEIKERLDIVEFINKYVPLKSTGKNFAGLCPFHNEKTPSFMVNPEIQRYKCYGCGKSGDIFNFLQEMETLDFPEALDKLAKEAGIEYKRGSNNTYFTKLEEINLKAQQFYSSTLEKAPIALKYLKDRGFTDESIKQFDIGFAPSYNALYKYISKLGFSERIINDSGLFTKKSDQIKDKFVNRIMFPLRSTYGKIIGFSGRNLPGDDFGPKYLNTPETPIFKKRENLYGFYLAKSSIKKEDLCILCEGQIDVISAFSQGVTNVVAPLGTGLTEQQLENIAKYTNKILFLFDKDNAGQKALERGFILANKYSFISYASNPEPYQDLDELIQKEPALLKETVKPKNEAYSYLVINFANYYDNSDLDSASKIIKYHQQLTENVTNVTFKRYYLKKLKALTGININKEKRVETKKINTKRNIISISQDIHGQEEYLLLLAIKTDMISNLKKLNLKYFTDLGVKEIIESLNKGSYSNIKQLLDSQDITESTKILLENIILKQDQYQELTDPVKELNSVYILIKINYYKQLLNQLQYKLSQAEELKDDEKIKKYATKVVELSSMIKNLDDKNRKL